MRTTVDLDRALLKRLRVEARTRGVTIKELLATLLRRGLDTTPSAASPRYRAPSFDMGAPNTGLNLDKALRVADALESEEIVRELSLRR